MCIDTFSYLLGKKKGGGGSSVDDYFVKENEADDYYKIKSYIKKIPYTIDLKDKTSTGNLCEGFYGLEEISFKNGQNVVTASYMFRACANLKFIDIRDFILTNITASTQMFGNTTWGRVPLDCLIIVKDNEQKQWMNTNFSSYTNVKTPEEL